MDAASWAPGARARAGGGASIISPRTGITPAHHEAAAVAITILLASTAGIGRQPAASTDIHSPRKSRALREHRTARAVNGLAVVPRPRWAARCKPVRDCERVPLMSDPSAKVSHPPLRVLVFSASPRTDSFNTKLARLAAKHLVTLGATVDLAPIRDFDVP